MSDKMDAVSLATLKQLAKDRGIEPCCSVECDQVACYRTHWVNSEVHYCETCARQAQRVGTVLFGMSIKLTRIPLPTENASIGAPLANEDK